MKVLLINPPSKTQPVARDMAGGLGFDGGNSIVLPPLDLATYAATLLGNNHEVKIIDSDIEGYTKEAVYQIVSRDQPDAIVTNISLPSIDNDCAFLRGLQEYSSAKMIAKTNMAFQPLLKDILEKSLVDLCVYGECDTNIDKIIAGEENAGTAYLQNNDLKLEGDYLINDLNTLPIPARQLLPNEKYHYILLGNKVTTMQTSRGCPFPCSYYCAYPLVQGRKWRARSPEHVLIEIEDIVKNHGIKKIFFRDATFTLDNTRTETICNLILQNKMNIKWWCETRVDCLNPELMKKMKKAGCLGMNIGVETGDLEVLQTQAKIGMTLEKLKTIKETGQKLGLKLHFLLMVGLPNETKQSLYKTYKLICDLRPESIGICIVTPYPGTPLYFEAKKKGWIETEDWTKFGGHFPIMHTDNLSTQDLIKAWEMIYEGFHLLQKGLGGWIRLRSLDYRFKRWVQVRGKL